MFKATEFERKNMRKKSTYPYANKSLFHYFLLSLQRLSWDSLGTKNISSTHAQNFWNVNKS